MPVLCRRIRRQQPGFSLVELSVVMAIISIVSVMGLEMVATFMTRTAYQTTQQKLATIDAAIVKYRQVYGHLPCPADWTANNFSSSYGKAWVDGSGNCLALGNAGNTVRHGDIPIRDLDLPLSYMVDGYGSKFTYVVTTAMANSAASFNLGASADLIPIRTGKLEQPCATLCQQIGTAAYVLLSYGSDKRGAWNTYGAYTTCVASANDQTKIDSANCRFDNGIAIITPATIPIEVFYDSRYNSGTVYANHFDDIIVWRSKAQL